MNFQQPIRRRISLILLPAMIIYAFAPCIAMSQTCRTGRTISISQNPFRYSRYYSDCESDLFYCKARYYSTALERFTSRDIFDLANRYSYCTANPVNNIDPEGHNTTPLDYVGIGLNEVLLGFPLLVSGALAMRGNPWNRANTAAAAMFGMSIICSIVASQIDDSTAHDIVSSAAIGFSIAGMGMMINSACSTKNFFKWNNYGNIDKTKFTEKIAEELHTKDTSFTYSPFIDSSHPENTFYAIQLSSDYRSQRILLRHNLESVGKIVDEDINSENVYSYDPSTFRNGLIKSAVAGTLFAGGEWGFTTWIEQRNAGGSNGGSGGDNSGSTNGFNASDSSGGKAKSLMRNAIAHAVVPTPGSNALLAN